MSRDRTQRISAVCAHTSSNRAVQPAKCELTGRKSRCPPRRGLTVPADHGAMPASALDSFTTIVEHPCSGADRRHRARPVAARAKPCRAHADQLLGPSHCPRSGRGVAPRRSQRRSGSTLSRRTAAADRRVRARHRRWSDHEHQVDRQPRQAEAPRAGRRLQIAPEANDVNAGIFAVWPPAPGFASPIPRSTADAVTQTASAGVNRSPFLVMLRHSNTDQTRSRPPNGTRCRRRWAPPAAVRQPVADEQLVDRRARADDGDRMAARVDHRVRPVGRQPVSAPQPVTPTGRGDPALVTRICLPWRSR